MTPGARVSATIEILDRYLLGNPEHKVLINWFRANRYAGSKDRLAIRNLFFNCLRYKLSCHWPFKQFGVPLCGRSLILGMLKVSDKCLDDIFDGKQYSPENLSKLEKVILNTFDEILASAPTSVRLNYPEFLENSLKDSFGHKFEKNLVSLNSEANLFIRINLIKGTVDHVINSLRDEGIELEPIPRFKNSFKVTKNRKKIDRSKVYLSGQIEIQDISSQAIVNFINPKQNTKILDFCAGGGGKTLSMASFTLGKAKFFAHDTNSSKLPNLQMRCRRAGFKVQMLSPTKIKERKSQFDLVVVDVPCSGTGVWKRNPGSKWVLTENYLYSLILNQKKILKEAAKYVKKDGALAYITCSVLKTENHDQIESFLSADKNFSFGADTFIPPLEGGDGFYASLINKIN